MVSKWGSWDEWNEWVDDVQSHNGCELRLAYDTSPRSTWSGTTDVHTVWVACETHNIDIAKIGEYEGDMR